MAMNRKAQMFTIAAILFLAILVFAILLQGRRSLPDETAVIGTRATAMNEFVKSVDDDIERGMFITSFRSILGMQQYIATTGNYLVDTESAFREALLNGSVEGQLLLIMNDSTFTNWTSRIEGEADTVGFDVNFTIQNVDIYHASPWAITVESDIDISLTDRDNTASWALSRNLIAEIPVEGLEDPVYTVETNGRIVRQINRTPYEGFYIQNPDTTNLTTHIDLGLYTNSTGPTFLMRLEGNFSNSTGQNGIESFVIIPDLQDQGMTVFERSSVDYVYFGAFPLTFFTINNTHESWFRIDEGHLGKYQARNSTV